MIAKYLNKNVNSFVYSKELNSFITNSNNIAWYGDTRSIMLYNSKTNNKKEFVYKGMDNETDHYWLSSDGIKLIITK